MCAVFLAAACTSGTDEPNDPNNPENPGNPNEPNNPENPDLPNHPEDSDVYSETIADFSFDMVYVKGGTFMMGATEEQGADYDGDEKPVHQVTLSDYYIGKHEVTYDLWGAVMGKNPSIFSGDDDKPVCVVSYYDIGSFLRELNKLTGKNYVLPTET